MWGYNPNSHTACHHVNRIKIKESLTSEIRLIVRNGLRKCNICKKGFEPSLESPARHKTQEWQWLPQGNKPKMWTSITAITQWDFSSTQLKPQKRPTACSSLATVLPRHRTLGQVCQTPPPAAGTAPAGSRSGAGGQPSREEAILWECDPDFQ